MPKEEYQARTTRYLIKHLLAFTTLLAISVALLIQGGRPQSSLWGFGVPAGMTLMTLALFYAGAKFSSKRGSIVRVISCGRDCRDDCSCFFYRIPPASTESVFRSASSRRIAPLIDIQRGRDLMSYHTQCDHVSAATPGQFYDLFTSTTQENDVTCYESPVQDSALLFEWSQTGDREMRHFNIRVCNDNCRRRLGGRTGTFCG